ncbi:MAG: YobA family protein [Kiritimatiellae bacterium]|nr:YobA family protein [Kiritimatiellia bacterium]
MRRHDWLGAILVIVAAGGCEADDAPPLPDGGAYIRGVITAVERDRVRIEENPREPSGSQKAVLRVTAHTVLRWRGSGAPATLADLRPGRTVRAWVTGPVAESYPVQGTAAKIEIE